MFNLFHRKKNAVDFLDPDEVLADSFSHTGLAGAPEGKLERPLERIYIYSFFLLIGIGIFYLAARAVELQVKHGDEFFGKSDENRFFARSIIAPRGIIYDRFNKPLVQNSPSFGLIFEKRAFLKDKGDLKHVLRRLSELLGEDSGFFFGLGFPESYDVAKLPSQIVITTEIPFEKLVLISSSLSELSGVQIFENYRRIYEDPYAFSHLLGFVGRVSEDDAAQNPELNYEELIGKTGIEFFYDSVLRGKTGKKIVEIDAKGKETRFKLTEAPEPGEDIRLTINGELEKVAYNALKNYTRGEKGGSVIILDPRDGAVRALVSFPGFDSNRFGSSLSNQEFQGILNDPLTPLFNRAVAGEFPSGSIIKPLIGAAALEEKIIDPNKKIYDEGYIEIPNPYKPGEKSVFPDWRKQGWINFYDAIAWSANVYFYMIGGGYQDQPGLGIERIKKYALAFGLGSKLGIDLPGEKPGLIPDPEWKKINEPDNPIWRIGDTYHVSIGQGGLEVTPLQMASLTSTIVNGGNLYRPHILDAILDKDGNVKEKINPSLIREKIVSQESLSNVIKGMRETVTIGTARLLNNLPVPAGAKTGTAQAGSGIPHAWVTVFAPVEKPEIAIVVMVEHAGEGATVAVPITYEILNWYFNNRPR